MDTPIVFRAVIEVLGRPQEYVETALSEYIEKLKKDSNFKLVSANLEKAQKQEKEELWSNFAELEIKTEKIENITSFCFDYMPSVIEILEPEHVTINDVQFSSFLNDLQAKLHNVDMIAKQAKLESDYLKKNSGILLKNFIFVILARSPMTSEQLSRLSGVKTEQIEDILDKFIDEGKVDLKGKIYSFKSEVK